MKCNSKDITRDQEKSSGLKSCPFCGGEATFKSERYGGTMSSGMETDHQTVGCKQCGIWLPKVGGGDNPYTAKLKVKDHQRNLAMKWNARAGAE